MFTCDNLYCGILCLNYSVMYISYFKKENQKHKQYIKQFNHENIIIIMKYLLIILSYMDDFLLKIEIYKY